MESLRITLEQSEIPTHWYNVVADMPNPPPPPLGPDCKPVSPEQMGMIFPMAILEQEMSAERWIPIPERVREVYRLWRPSPLIRARRLEEVLGTPARIYYKYEGVSPAGSHKPNTAVPQAFYNQQAGDQTHRDRDRGRAVGLFDGLCWPDVWPRGAGLYGQDQLPAEALPPLDDADLGRRSVRQPVEHDPDWP